MGISQRGKKKKSKLEGNKVSPFIMDKFSTQFIYKMLFHNSYLKVFFKEGKQAQWSPVIFQFSPVSCTVKQTTGKNTGYLCSVRACIHPSIYSLGIYSI